MDEMILGTRARQEKRTPTLFSLKLRRARQRARWDGKPVRQKDVARVLGVSHSTYFRWEKGVQQPEDEHVANLAKILQMNEDDIWIDTYRIPPDIRDFLTSTEEGARVIRNIRIIMNKMEATQPPTRRKGLPKDDDVLRAATRLANRNDRRMARDKAESQLA